MNPLQYPSVHSGVGLSSSVSQEFYFPLTATTSGSWESCAPGVLQFFGTLKDPQ